MGLKRFGESIKKGDGVMRKFILTLAAMAVILSACGQRDEVTPDYEPEQAPPQYGLYPQADIY